MIEKALAGLFKVVSDEAAASPAFARRLEDSLAAFAEDFVRTRRAELAVADFHPLIEFRKGTPEDFRARLKKFDKAELRLIVQNHNLDPADELTSRASPKVLIEHIAMAAQKRAERDARLFEY